MRLGECDSPLQFFASFRRGESHSPPFIFAPFAFVHVYIHPIIIRLYHYFIEQMPIGRMRFAPTIFPHHSVDIIVVTYSIGRIHNGRMRFAPTLAHIYIIQIPCGRIAFAPIFIHPNIYSIISSIPMGECDSPLHWHTYIYYSNPVRANRIRPLIYPSPIYIPPFHPFNV